MRVSVIIATLLPLCTAQSSILFTAAGTQIHTLNFSGNSLELSSSINACGTNPSWLTLTPDTLFCSNEATPGSLSSFGFDITGNLTEEAVVNTTGGDVSSVTYGDGKFIALAHFGHSSIETYSLPITNTSEPIQNLSLPFPGPGPNPRQTTGQPHQVIVDPTGQYLFSPDLGADLIRVFTIDQVSGSLCQCSQIKMDPGSGPRHVAFFRASNATSSNPTFVYVVSELSGLLTGFRMDVSFNASMPTFTQIITPIRTVDNAINASQVFVAEVSVVNNTLTVSNRGDASFGDGIDSLVVFQIANSGTLSDPQLFSSRGNFPRSFQISPDGTKIAVANQRSQNVVVMERNITTGAIGDTLGSLKLPGEVLSVVWASSTTRVI